MRCLETKHNSSPSRFSKGKEKEKEQEGGQISEIAHWTCMVNRDAHVYFAFKDSKIPFVLASPLVEQKSSRVKPRFIILQTRV